MAIDFDALKAAVDEAQKQAQEATDASSSLQSAQDALNAANTHLQEATDSFKKENDERVVALQAIIELVQAGLA